MSLVVTIGLLLVLVILFIAAFVVIGGVRTRGRVQRALNMILFLVQVPKEYLNSKENQSQPQKQEKDVIAIGELMLASFGNIHAKGWNKFFYGEPYLALEMSVHHVGEETHLYIAVPQSVADIVEKQIHSYYPTADVTRDIRCWIVAVDLFLYDIGDALGHGNIQVGFLTHMVNRHFQGKIGFAIKKLIPSFGVNIAKTGKHLIPDRDNIFFLFFRFLLILIAIEVLLGNLHQKENHVERALDASPGANAPDDD